MLVALYIVIGFVLGFIAGALAVVKLLEDAKDEGLFSAEHHRHQQPD